MKKISITKNGYCNLIRVTGRRCNDTSLKIAFELIWDTWSSIPTWIYREVDEGASLPIFSRIDSTKIELDFSNCASGAIALLIDGASSVVYL